MVYLPVVGIVTYLIFAIFAVIWNDHDLLPDFNMSYTKEWIFGIVYLVRALTYLSALGPR
jgi:hypothetical protein